MSQPIRRRLSALVAACALLVVALPATAAAPAQGSSMPAFQLPMLGGGEVGPAQMRDRVVLIDFWASWCVPCRLSMPALAALREEFAGEPVLILPVSVDTEATPADRFLDRYAPGLSSALDSSGAVAEKFRPKGMPTSYIIDREGIVRVVHEGYRRGDDAKWRREIRSLLDRP